MSKLWYWMESPKTPMLSQNALVNLNNEEDKSQDADYNHPNKETVAEKDSMFEKPLTPSDVGKLNRLVIPKQHAERYFPIGGGGGGGGDSVEKGVLLSFEDELGKLWKFRYSYWNSSQSYVLTKGWSRFVKEKSLETGDTVVFERFRDDGNRFFIGWRRRNTVVGQAAGGWSPAAFYSGIQPYPSQYSRPNGPPLPYQPHCLHAEGATSAGVHNKRSNGNCRTVRLFGVDLECQLEEPLSGGPNQGEPHYCQTSSTTTSHVSQNHPHDINFSSDVNQTRDEHG